MTEEKKVFYWGIGLMIVSVLFAAVLQQLNRNQSKKLNNLGKQITKTKQDIASASADFASYDKLENLVVTVYPDAEVVGFNKSIDINDIDFRKERDQ